MEKKKNQFWRTVAGKTLLFIALNLTVILLICSIGCVAGSISCDLYTRSVDEFIKETAEERIRYNSVTYASALLLSREENFTPVNVKIVDDQGNVLAQSRTFSDAEAKAQSSSRGYLSSYTFDGFLIYDSNENLIRLEDGLYYGSDPENGKTVPVTVITYADPVEDAGFSDFEIMLINMIGQFRYIAIFTSIASLLLGISAFIALMSVAGRKPGSDDICQGPLFRIPFDILFAAFSLMIVPVVIICDAAPNFAEIALTLASGLVFLNLFLGLCVSFAARVKLHALLKGTAVYKLLVLIWKLIKLIFKGIISIPLVWRSVLIFSVISFVELIALTSHRGAVIFWFFEKFLLLPAVIYIALMLRRLKISGEKIAKGDITHRTSTKGLWGDFRKHAVNLNAVADSVTLAVDERLRSERMKTELITNVSHDIKTPLTSIINYASLIGNAEPSDPKLPEYSEVILRQSEKLKRLIEDLVEASKASTGNLEIVSSPLDCCTFISQTAGEFKEKLENCNLTLVSSAPDDNVMIMADGRRMMRIFDNLMNNICKYAQPGTRVYLTLNVADGRAITTFKNTSSAELNISADELVERFVRGDSSRNTEGNGLGLSIAKSLTELQGGDFNITIDGDLFKVTLSFPVIL